MLLSGKKGTDGEQDIAVAIRWSRWDLFGFKITNSRFERLQINKKRKGKSTTGTGVTKNVSICTRSIDDAIQKDT